MNKRKNSSTPSLSKVGSSTPPPTSPKSKSKPSPQNPRQHPPKSTTPPHIVRYEITSTTYLPNIVTWPTEYYSVSQTGTQTQLTLAQLQEVYGRLSTPPGSRIAKLWGAVRTWISGLITRKPQTPPTLFSSTATGSRGSASTRSK